MRPCAPEYTPLATGCKGRRPAPSANEFTFRLNDGDVKCYTLERLASLVTASFGPHIIYKELTA